MFFPQNGLDYDEEKLKGMADRTRERMTRDAEMQTLPWSRRLAAFLKNHIGLVLLAAAAVVVLVISLIAGN